MWVQHSVKRQLKLCLKNLGPPLNPKHWGQAERNKWMTWESTPLNSHDSLTSRNQMDPVFHWADNLNSNSGYSSSKKQETPG